MKSAPCVLAVDIGSSSVKAALISVAGDVIATSGARIDLATPFPARWINAIKAALASTLKAAGSSIDARALDSLIVSGAGPTLAAVNVRGEVIAHLLWNDPAPPPAAPLPKGAERSIFFPRMAALPKAFPGIEQKARRVFSGPELAVFALCGGEYTVLPEERYVSAYWDSSLIEAAGFNPLQFPPFCPPGAVAGAYKEDATPYSSAFADVLPEGLPIRAGLPDFAVALLGTGTILPGRACDRSGTSEGLNVCTAAPVYAEGLRTLPSPVSGLWNISCLFADTGCELDRIRSLSSQDPALARTTAEKLCLKLKDGVERLKAATGFSPEFVLSGGQAKSRAWCQMKADMTGAAFLLTQTENAELLGDAITAFCAAGEYSSYQEACSAMIRITERFDPSA